MLKVAMLTLSLASVLIAAPSLEAAPLSVVDVKASSHDGNVPQNTRDGDLTTRWSAKGDGQWIAYELELCDTVLALKIAWHKGDTRVASFDIEVADAPNGPWTPVHSGDSAGNTLEFETVDIPDTPACFVRIVGHGNSSPHAAINPWTSIAEVEIEGLDPEPEPDPEPTTVPIPLALLEELCSQLPAQP